MPGDAAGITYDDSVLTFTVDVEANADKTALVAQVTPSSTQGFVNSYKAAEPASSQAQTSTAASEPYHAAAVIITASVSQPGGKSAAGSMTFDVVDDSGAVVTTGTNDANGTVRFSTIELSEAGEYTYTVRPAQGTSLSAVASSGETPSYRVTVKVEDTGCGLRRHPCCRRRLHRSLADQGRQKRSRSCGSWGFQEEVALRLLPIQTGRML